LRNLMVWAIGGKTLIKLDETGKATIFVLN